MLYKQTNMFHLLSLLASILTGLRKAVAGVSPRGRARSPVITPPSDHLDHMFACLERLYADWCHGTLPEPCERADLPGTGTPRLSRPTPPDPTLPALQPPPDPPPRHALQHPGSRRAPHPRSLCSGPLCSGPLCSGSIPAAPWMPSPSPPTPSQNGPEPCVPIHVLIVPI